jgi:hypothetical protein
MGKFLVWFPHKKSKTALLWVDVNSHTFVVSGGVRVRVKRKDTGGGFTKELYLLRKELPFFLIM